MDQSFEAQKHRAYLEGKHDGRIEVLEDLLKDIRRERSQPHESATKHIILLIEEAAVELLIAAKTARSLFMAQGG